MYRAKELGKARCEIFDDSMRATRVERLELESGLRRALDLGELHLVYQPHVTLATGEVTGVEALLRWDHPLHGTVGPLQFIPLAERNGLIIPIGAWVLHEACRQLAAWGDDALERRGQRVRAPARRTDLRRHRARGAASRRHRPAAPVPGDHRDGDDGRPRDDE